MSTDTTATATIDETTLSPVVQEMLSLMRTAVADAERVQPKKDKRDQRSILLSLVLDGTDEDIKGLTKFREILNAKAAEILAAESGSEEVSDEERARVRKDSKEKYVSASNVLGMVGGVPDGFVLPEFPGARGGSTAGSGAGGEKPRNLKHTVRNAEGAIVPKCENVTFAVIGQATKESTPDLLARFKSVAGENKEDWQNAGPWEWTFTSGEGENATEYTVTTKYDAPA